METIGAIVSGLNSKQDFIITLPELFAKNMVERRWVCYVTTIYVNFLDGLKYRRKISGFVAFFRVKIKVNQLIPSQEKFGTLKGVSVRVEASLKVSRLH